MDKISVFNIAPVCTKMFIAQCIIVKLKKQSMYSLMSKE